MIPQWLKLQPEPFIYNHPLDAYLGEDESRPAMFYARNGFHTQERYQYISLMKFDYVGENMDLYWQQFRIYSDLDLARGWHVMARYDTEDGQIVTVHVKPEGFIDWVVLHGGRFLRWVRRTPGVYQLLERKRRKQRLALAEKLRRFK